MSSLILEKLHKLRLPGMSKAYNEQETNDAYSEMSFNDRLSSLIEREIADREDKALRTRLGKARFRQLAALEEFQPSANRGLDRATIKQLSQCDWLRQKRNIIITGPSGCGKTFFASALSHKACLQGHTARYFRATTLLSELEASRADGRYRRLLTSLGKIHCLIIDDFCLSNLSETEEKDLFELIEERHNLTSTIFTSQNPVNIWHGLMPNPAIADAVLDRIVHHAVRIELKGDSFRKKLPKEIDEPLSTE